MRVRGACESAGSVGAAQWLAFSCGVKTTMVFVSVGEKRQECSESERTQWDASSQAFIRNKHCAKSLY